MHADTVWNAGICREVTSHGYAVRQDAGIRPFKSTSPHVKEVNKKKLYKTVKVRLWKDKVWELGGLGGFSKKKLISPDDPAYIEKFIIECNKGVVTHRLSYPIGFLVMLTLGGTCSLTIALPVAVVNLFLNILPTLVLRYNTPMLQGMLKRLKRKRGE